jgi:NAD(P)-dependent dehydrogenase (short-subunit alcohol dehydrogenase family)
MTNKLCIITGANSGIGFETAKELARQGAFIVMVCRNEDKAVAAKRAIQQDTPSAGIDIVLCDFSSQDEIRKAADEIINKYEKIDILINNHGFIASEYQETVDGFESTFAVNHLGYFLFTNLLLPTILNSGSARIINVASEAHRNGTFDPENLQLKDNFKAWQAYGNSKLFNILFTIELAERLKGTDVTANCLHPGVVKTNFSAGLRPMFKLFWWIGQPFMKSEKEGAQTTIYLATSPEVEEVNGAYFADCKVKTPRKQALDPTAARKLWEISEEFTGLNQQSLL